MGRGRRGDVAAKQVMSMARLHHGVGAEGCVAIAAGHVAAELALNRPSVPG